MKILKLILICVLCFCLCACGGKTAAEPAPTEPEVVEITEPIETEPPLKLIQAAEFHYTLNEGCQEKFNLVFYITNRYNPDFGAAGIYMVDLDTGITYDDTFLNWDLMIRDGEWNMDTRDVALMNFYNSYDSNKNGNFMWAETETYLHYSAEEVEQLNAVIAAGQIPASIAEDALVKALDPQFLYEQAKLLNIQLKSVTGYQVLLNEGYRELVSLLFVQSTEHEGVNEESIAKPGLYMLDLGTGEWYDASFLDESVMIKGNAWNYRSRKAAIMCLYNGFSWLQPDGFVKNPQETLIRLEDSVIEEINQKLLLDQFTHKAAVYPYASIEDEPRKLSDEDLANLMHRPAGYIKSAISTIPDAIAYLDLRFPSLWMGMSLHNGTDLSNRWLRSAVTTISDYTNPASRSCMVNAVSYLLSDDYQIESLIAFWTQDDTADDGPQKAINFIKTNTGYLFFDPVLRMQGDAESRKGALLPEMACGSMAEYIEKIRTNPGFSADIKYIFKNTNGARMDYVRSFAGGYSITTASEGIELVYYSSGAELAAPEDAVNLIAPENIGNYKLSKMLGGVTLTPDEARALVGAAPEVVQEKVKTAADVLMYMLAARTGDTQGCLCIEVGKYTWHWNISAKEVMALGLGNCGSCANLANYLLDGDYEEVGFVDQAYYPGNGGSHVYTYIRYEGKYYILDYSWYIFNNYDVNNDFAVPVIDSLSQWPEKIQWIYGPVCLVMTYDTPGRQYPVIFGDQYESAFDGIYYILPEGIEYTVLYEAPDGYQYKQIPFDTSVYDWNVFWKE